MGMKSILFINQHYYPEYVSAGQHLTDLAEYLAAEGFRVKVLCGKGGYTGESKSSPKKEKHNGVHIRRLSTTDFGRSSTLGRITDYATFFTQALLHVLLSRADYDCVVTLTTPPLVNVIGAILKKVRDQKYGIWAMDLHPDAEVALGMIDTDGLIARVLHLMNNIGYRNADFVVALGRYMKKEIEKKGVDTSNVHTIPMWNKKEEVHPIPKEQNKLIDDLGLQDKFVVMYSGNAGLGHRFGEVLEMMRRLKNVPDIFFLFVGEGPRKEQIRQYTNRHDIQNFRYLSYFPRDMIKYSLSIADVHLLTLRHEMAGIVAPSKIYGIMGVGRPVIMVGPMNSEPAHTIKKEKVGQVIEPAVQCDVVDMRAARELEEVIVDLYEDENRRNVLGKRGRKVFMTKYEREKVCSDWSDKMDSIIKQ